MAIKPDDRTPKKEWAHAWQPTFLKWLQKKGNVTAACDKAKIARSWAYEVRDVDPEFAAEWDTALVEATERLEMEARRRAEDGVLEPVYYQGERVGGIRKYSDTLMIFLLKAHAPEKYRDNSRIEHTGKGGGPIETQDVGLSDNERAARIVTLLDRARARRDGSPDSGDGDLEPES